MSYHFILPFIFISYFSFVLSSCTEDYQLPRTEGQPVIVIEGLITNEKGPYFVKLGRSATDHLGVTTWEGIDHATVIIRDDTGNTDRLLCADRSMVDSVLIESGTVFGSEEKYEIWNYFLKIPDYEDGYILYELKTDNYRPHPRYDMLHGFYITTSVEGVPGRTYSLEVECDGKAYISTEKMPYGTMLDSVSLEPVGKYIYNKDDGEDGFDVPHLYFAEPKNETNYYMFTYNQGFTDDASGMFKLKYLMIRATFQYEFWPLSVISDRYLPEYVNKYKMSQGDHPYSYYTGTDIQFQGYYYNCFTAHLLSISEPVYKYYYGLSLQYYDDGGTFGPAPASPQTNISNGAHGCFVAATVSSYQLACE